MSDPTPQVARWPTEPGVLLTRDGGVATITLNRPRQMNSLDVATKVALRDAVAEVAEDPDVRCVVLTGTGRAFCVGQDLKEHVELLESGGSDALFTTVPDHYNPIVTALATMPKPVIAAVNGVAAGAGASLAFACDYGCWPTRPGSTWRSPGIALSCDTGSSWTLPRLVGRAKAIELLYEPRTIDAEESLALGLATRVVRGRRAAGRGRERSPRGSPPARPWRTARSAARWPSPARTLRGVAGLRGRDDGAHRRDRGPPQRRRVVRGQGAADLPRPLTPRPAQPAPASSRRGGRRPCRSPA